MSKEYEALKDLEYQLYDYSIAFSEEAKLAGLSEDSKYRLEIISQTYANASEVVKKKIKKLEEKNIPCHICGDTSSPNYNDISELNTCSSCLSD